jgi:hypothetical protein
MANTTTSPSHTQRRALLQAAAGLAAASTLGVHSMAIAAGATKPAATGNPGDFDFLSGNWNIKNRQLKNGAWESFDGEATFVLLVPGRVARW